MVITASLPLADPQSSPEAERQVCKEECTMKERILCVDDDALVLSAYQRLLRKDFITDVAQGGAAALQLMKDNAPYAVVLTDMRMPSMDGNRFLSQVKTKYPMSVRMMLTGYADQRTAIDAVNDGHIFRFLTKPCSPEILMQALRAGIRQYHLQTAEHDLLDQTLGGCVDLLIELMALSDPTTFARTQHMRERIQLITKHMGEGDSWEIGTAAMLAPIGSATIPPLVLLKSRAGRTLSSAEMDMLKRVP